MTREQLLSTARKHMWAAWQLSSEELASQAAEALLGLGMLVPESGAQELEKSRTRVAELEADLHVMQKALFKALDRVTELEAERHETNEALSDAAEALRANRDRIDALEAAPPTVYRAEHPDSGITLGHYGTEAAAREHCETTERRSWLKGTTLVFDWIEDDEDRVAELVVSAGQNEESTTGYIVTALELASEYNPDADE